MKYIPIIALGALLSGCGFTSQGDFLRGAAAIKGAQAMDKGVANAEWFLCKGASAGAVQRRYGVSLVKANAWRAICQADSAVTVIGP